MAKNKQPKKDSSASTSIEGRLAARFRRPARPEVAVPDARKLDKRQQHQLIIAVIIALIAGYFLFRDYFGVIILSLLGAIIFYPVYNWIFQKTHKPGTASMLTLLIALLIVIIPLILATFATVHELQKFIAQMGHFATNGSETPSQIANRLLHEVNQVLDSVTGGAYQISSEQIAKAVASVGGAVANFFLDVITASFSSIPAFITQFILFIYLFSSMLTNSEKLLGLFSDLNPLGDDVSGLYFARTGEMTRGIVSGQFVIAFCQGVSEAAVLYLLGVDYFFFFAMLLTFLSIIPLGAGILTIPLSIIMVLTGNVWGGLSLFLYHTLVVTNIDNVLRPRLVPKSVRINSALMMLAVFGGIGLFGFLGIAIGPIVIILVISTIQVYLPLARAQKGRSEVIADPVTE